MWRAGSRDARNPPFPSGLVDLRDGNAMPIKRVKPIQQHFNGEVGSPFRALEQPCCLSTRIRIGKELLQVSLHSCDQVGPIMEPSTLQDGSRTLTYPVDFTQFLGERSKGTDTNNLRTVTEVELLFGL
ncbi:hypothetical protein RvY_01580 [Ramazzottius varieornatus]|uniref:Uncharacterized protein n=1 Tax=Ramazzottius varieornatus TaxID=947166 RepID=A0A1D1UH34_RAMVA|nr:hypothetical protein RvY_01580 [Ramazzottius varieornatus]